MSFNIGIGTPILARTALASCVVLIANIAIAQSIRGTATYRERMALPPAAVFEATLEDVSRADAPAEPIARTRITSPGNPPIAFAIAYEQTKILPDHRYVVRASILVNDKLLFTSDTAAPVITRGSPTTVSILLRRVSAGQTASPDSAGSRPLEGTSWRLVNFRGGNDATLTPDDRAKYTIEFGTGGRRDLRVRTTHEDQAIRI